jgi:hypothetical protein
MLRRILPELGEAAPLALLVGAVIGAAMVSLVSGTLGQSTNESLQALALGSLQVVTPVGVSLIWICRCAPLRLAEGVRRQLRQPPRSAGVPRAWTWNVEEMLSAACSAMLLVPWFEAGLLVGGLLLTPRAELGLASELRELISLMRVSDLLQCFLRTAVFTAAAQGLCLRKAAQVKHSEVELAVLLADALPECLLLVMGLEVIWLTLFVPLHGPH